MRLLSMTLVSAGLVLASFGAAGAEDEKPDAQPAAAAAAVGESAWELPPDPRLPDAPKDFQPAAGDFPENVRLLTAEELKGKLPATESAARYWDKPGAGGFVDKPPVDKHAFALQAEGGKPGTVYVYEYPEGVNAAENAADFLSLLLWLAEDYPTPERPDQVHFAGRYAFVFSFPLSDPAVEWFKSHLRQSFSVPAPTDNKAHHEVYAALAEAEETGDPAAVLAAYAKFEEKAKGDSYCRMTAARWSRDVEDWPAVLAHYQAALDLTRSVADPIDSADVFEAFTWSAYSLMYQDRPKDALPGFRAAKAWGIPRDVPGSAVWGPYNVACALSRMGKLDEAVVELRESVAANPEIALHALDDTDMAPLRERKDVTKLLADAAKSLEEAGGEGE